MHDCIIKNWRNTVQKNDIVYILGDLGMYHAHEIAEIISSLPGNQMPDDVYELFLKKYHLIPKKTEIEKLLVDFNNKFHEAQQARWKLIDYLEENFDLDDVGGQVENRNDWCFGIDNDVVQGMIETKN